MDFNLPRVQKAESEHMPYICQYLCCYAFFSAVFFLFCFCGFASVSVNGRQDVWMLLKTSRAAWSRVPVPQPHQLWNTLKTSLILQSSVLSAAAHQKQETHLLPHFHFCLSLTHSHSPGSCPPSLTALWSIAHSWALVHLSFFLAMIIKTFICQTVSIYLFQ